MSDQRYYPFRSKQLPSKGKIFLYLFLACFLTFFALYIYTFLPNTKLTKYPEQIIFDKFLLGSIASTIVVYDDNEAYAKKCVNEIYASWEKYYNIFSIDSTNSEISSVNQNAFKQETQISVDLLDIIDKALQISIISQKYSEKNTAPFDITIKPLKDLWNKTENLINEGEIKNNENILPKEAEINNVLKNVGFNNIILNNKNKTIKYKNPNTNIILDDILKGYLIDKAVNIIEKHQYRHYLIQLGNITRLKGYQPNDEEKKGWHFRIQNPFFEDSKYNDRPAFKNKQQYFYDFYVTDGAISSSGIYERGFYFNEKRYSRIIDPSSGYPASSQNASVTVISKSNILSDTLSIAFLVLGPEKSKKLVQEFPDVSYYMLVENGEQVEVHTGGNFQF